MNVLFATGAIAVLFIVLLPAIQWARESSRRSQCRENLRILGLALHGYHDTHKLFPPGIISLGNGSSPCTYVASADGCPSNGSQASGLALLLTFMEEKAVHDAYNFRLPCCQTQNATAVGCVVKTFLCPSNIRGDQAIQWSYYLPAPGVLASGPAPTDYVFNMGGNAILSCTNALALDTDGKALGYPGPFRPSAGPFNVNSGTSLRCFKKGSTNAILMGEAAGGPQLQTGEPVNNGNGPIVGGRAGTAVDQAWSQCYIPSNGTGGYGSVFAATAFNAVYDDVVKDYSKLQEGDRYGHWLSDSDDGLDFFPFKLNETKLRFARPTSYTVPSVIATLPATATALPSGINVSGFRSYHLGMCHFLFGDGSGRSISEEIDTKLLIYLSDLESRGIACE